MRQHSWAAMAVLEKTFGWSTRGGRVHNPKYWDNLVRKVGGAKRRRVVVSSEFFSQADEATARRIVDELGGDRVHVVATLRGLDRLLPSSWQQYVKNGTRHDYETWLKEILKDPPNRKLTPSFWERHDHGAVITRWAEIVGPERVTLIVLADQDRTTIYEAFERLVGLPAGFLAGQPRERDNRSMTAAEAEFVRRVNVAIWREEVSWEPYHKVIREGAVRRMIESRAPGPDEPRIVTPDWALARAAELGRRAADQIAGLGIQV